MARSVMGAALLAAVACGCNPAPVVPVVIEAGDAAPCGVDEAITANRMIRTDGGAPLVLAPCPEAGR